MVSMTTSAWDRAARRRPTTARLALLLAAHLLAAPAALAQSAAFYVPPGPVTLETFQPPLTRLELSARSAGATPDTYRIDYGMVAMRDGIKLQTTVIRPKDDRPHPVILDRTPYATNNLPQIAKRIFASGYVLVIQNERGSDWSEGQFHFLGQTAQDGADTLAWIAAQPWSNGKVGLEGCSSSAENQLKLGAQGAPALKAMVPMSAGAGVGAIPGVTSQGLFYRGGAPMIATWSSWYAPFAYTHRPKLVAGQDAAEIARDLRNFSVVSPSFMSPAYNKALGESVRLAPSREILSRLGVPATEFPLRLDEGPAGPSWSSVDLINAQDTGATPALNIDGWYDIGAYEAVKLFEFQQGHPDQYLIMAPSAHCAMTETGAQASVGDRPVGDSRLAYDDIEMAWFDRFLKDDPAAWRAMPKVQTFLMGADAWLTGDRWPLRETRTNRLYLDARGAANTAAGGGSLRLTAPARQAADHYAYDPHDPTPSAGGGLIGAVATDQRAVEARQDVLVYSTEVLDQGLALVGDLRAVLFLKADVADTDIAVKLVDVYPDGTAYNVTDSLLRLRYRDGVHAPAPITPGQVYKVVVGEMTTSNYFAKGHRLRLEIAGANFPNSDRNWNTGGDNARATDGPVAHVQLFHGGPRASYLEFTQFIGPIPVKNGHAVQDAAVAARAGSTGPGK